MLDVERRGAAADTVCRGAGEPLAQVPPHRYGGEARHDRGVHARRAGQHEQVHVVTEVRIVLKRLRKEIWYPAGLACLADVTHQLQRRADTETLVGHRLREASRGR